MIAALFVAERGPYTGLQNVDAWTQERDARKYSGPYPVIAHSPCERWGKFAKIYGQIGQDDGCFESALNAVRKYGGLLEHPEGSLAFTLFALPIPKQSGGWTKPDKFGGRSCCVFQGHYGHRAPKPTWLYAKLKHYPDLIWGKTPPRDLSHLDAAARKRAIKTGICQRLSKRQRIITPIVFRDVLISMVSGVWK